MIGLNKKLIISAVGIMINMAIVNSPAEAANQAPDCSQATASPNVLWPANRKLTPIQIIGVTDPEDDKITIETQCIMQDEPIIPPRFQNWFSHFEAYIKFFFRFGNNIYPYDADGLGTDNPSIKAQRHNKWKDQQPGDGRVYDIIFKATDAQGRACVGTVHVNVPYRANVPAIDSGMRYPSVPDGENCEGAPVNVPPTIDSQPILDAEIGTTYQYKVIGHDEDNDVLQYSLEVAPTGANIDPDTGLIEWVPLSNQEGSQAFIVKLTDSGGLSATQAYDVIVTKLPEELAVSIIANPSTGVSPLRVRFSSVVNNNNIVFTNYAWDFDSDGTNDVSDTFGAPKTYTYTGNPGDTFTATLTVTPVEGDPLVATKTIIIDNQPPLVQVSSSVTNGHVPLGVSFVVTAQDVQGIDQVSIDFNGDGVFDATEAGNASTSGSWTFQTDYSTEGRYLAKVKVTDTFGAQTEITNNAITVEVNNVLDPVIEVTASPQTGDSPLTVVLTAEATLFDGSTITQWEWDLDGDGSYEITGGTSEIDTQNMIYEGVDYYYPSVKVTTESGRSVKASLRIKTTSNKVPSLSIPNSTDTINTDANEIANINVTLPNQTALELWIENAGGVRIKTIQTKQLTDAGDYVYNWDGSDQQNETVAEDDYYVVLGYSQLGIEKEIDLRNTTGGQLSYYRRTTTNPRQFNRLESPLVINYAVDEPAEVSFFWQVSFGTRLMTLMEHERMGRGQYSLYWNAEYPTGEKIPNSLRNLMPGIVRYALPDNVIFVKAMPRIEQYQLKSTIMADPRRESIDFDITLNKTGTVELVVADMEKGIEVATRVYPSLNGGQHSLSWDGKNNNDQYLAPGDYRLGVRSVDRKGSRSLFWYRTQRINY